MLRIYLKVGFSYETKYPFHIYRYIFAKNVLTILKLHVRINSNISYKKQKLPFMRYPDKEKR